MMSVEIRKGVMSDVASISPRMRAEDAHEVYASSKADPHNALMRSYIMSDYVKTVLIDGIPSAMFGVVCMNALERKGVPWLLGTDDVKKIPMRFLLGSNKEIKDMLKSYQVLENYVHFKNNVSKNWLQWLGFVLHDPEPWGPLGEKFHKFTMEGV